MVYVKIIFLLLFGLFITLEHVVSAKKHQQVNVALRTELEFNKHTDLKLIEKAQKYLRLIKNVLENTFRTHRRHKASKSYELNDVIKNGLEVITSLNDTDLKNIYNVAVKEFRKLNSKLKLVDINRNTSSRKALNNDLIEKVSAKDIRDILKGLLKKLDMSKYGIVLSYIDSMNNRDSENSITKMINNLHQYKTDRSFDLGKIIRRGVKNVFMEYYLNLDNMEKAQIKNLFINLWNKNEDNGSNEDNISKIGLKTKKYTPGNNLRTGRNNSYKKSTHALHKVRSDESDKELFNEYTKEISHQINIEKNKLKQKFTTSNIKKIKSSTLYPMALKTITIDNFDRYIKKYPRIPIKKGIRYKEPIRHIKKVAPNVKRYPHVPIKNTIADNYISRINKKTNSNHPTWNLKRNPEVSTEDTRIRYNEDREINKDLEDRHDSIEFEVESQSVEEYPQKTILNRESGEEKRQRNTKKYAHMNIKRDPMVPTNVKPVYNKKRKRKKDEEYDVKSQSFEIYEQRRETEEETTSRNIKTFATRNIKRHPVYSTNNIKPVYNKERKQKKDLEENDRNEEDDVKSQSFEIYPQKHTPKRDIEKEPTSKFVRNYYENTDKRIQYRPKKKSYRSREIDVKSQSFEEKKVRSAEMYSQINRDDNDEEAHRPRKRKKDYDNPPRNINRNSRYSTIEVAAYDGDKTRNENLREVYQERIDIVKSRSAEEYPRRRTLNRNTREVNSSTLQSKFSHSNNTIAVHTSKIEKVHDVRVSKNDINDIKRNKNASNETYVHVTTSLNSNKIKKNRITTSKTFNNTIDVAVDTNENEVNNRELNDYNKIAKSNNSNSDTKYRNEFSNQVKDADKHNVSNNINITTTETYIGENIIEKKSETSTVLIDTNTESTITTIADIKKLIEQSHDETIDAAKKKEIENIMQEDLRTLFETTTPNTTETLDSIQELEKAFDF